MAGVADTTALEAEEPEEGADEEEGALAPDVDVQVEATSQRMDEIPAFPVDSDSNRMMAETDALVAEALSHEVKEEHTIVVVADEERPRTEPAAFDTMEPQDSGSHAVAPILEPEAGTEELATPVLPDRRDLEPTDK